MKFSTGFTVDSANELLICEISGETKEIIELQHILKSIVKMAGKNQVTKVVLDVTNFKFLCTNLEVTELLIGVKESGVLGDLKIARIVKPEHNIQNVIAGLAESLSLPIKNFETRSEAMLWLLFDTTNDN